MSSFGELGVWAFAGMLQLFFFIILYPFGSANGIAVLIYDSLPNTK